MHKIYFYILYTLSKIKKQYFHKYLFNVVLKNFLNYNLGNKKDCRLWQQPFLRYFYYNFGKSLCQLKTYELFLFMLMCK